MTNKTGTHSAQGTFFEAPVADIVVPHWLGHRVFKCVGEQEYKRKDGRTTRVRVWRGECVFCYGPFEVLAPVNAGDKSNSFSTTTCKAHRLTPGESNRLKVVDLDKRWRAFENIRIRKTET